jgi:hypothetical protein
VSSEGEELSAVGSLTRRVILVVPWISFQVCWRASEVGHPSRRVVNKFSMPSRELPFGDDVDMLVSLLMEEVSVCHTCTASLVKRDLAE